MLLRCDYEDNSEIVFIYCIASLFLWVFNFRIFLQYYKNTEFKITVYFNSLSLRLM